MCTVLYLIMYLRWITTASDWPVLFYTLGVFVLHFKLHESNQAEVAYLKQATIH